MKNYKNFINEMKQSVKDWQAGVRTAQFAGSPGSDALKNPTFQAGYQAGMRVGPNAEDPSYMAKRVKRQKETMKATGSIEEGFLDKLQTAADVVGVVDPTPATDIANAAVSVARSRFAKDPKEKREHAVNAALRAVSAVPYAGDAVGKTALAAKAGTKVGFKSTRGAIIRDAQLAAKEKAIKDTKARAEGSIEESDDKYFKSREEYIKGMMQSLKKQDERMKRLSPKEELEAMKERLKKTNRPYGDAMKDEEDADE
jgi:hypothetical protein